MSRTDPDTLADAERIFIALTLREAREVEQLLTNRGVDYAVQVELLSVTTLFGSRRNGAVFFVTASVAGWCRELLRSAGLDPGVVEGE